MNEQENIPKGDRERREWIKFKLSLQNLSISALAEKNNCSRQALSAALSKPTKRLGPIIEQAIKVPASKIWPESCPSWRDTYHERDEPSSSDLEAEQCQSGF